MIDYIRGLVAELNPAYVVVDKDGNVKNKHIGYPGNEVREEELK